MKSLFIKILFIVAIFVIVNMAIAFLIKNYLYHYLDERKYLFYEKNYAQYEIVISGDSVFCSSFSTARDKTLWAVLSRISGKKVFPGAIDGAKVLDLVYTAEYLAPKLKPGTIVFLDSTASRNWDNKLSTNYQIRFFCLRGYPGNDLTLYERMFNSLIVPFTGSWFRGRDMFEIIATSGGKSYTNKHAKNWRNSIDVTRLNKRNYDKIEKPVAYNKNATLKYTALKEINDIYRKNNIRLVVFVSPFNVELCKIIKNDANAYRIYHDNLVEFLNKNNIEFIDCFYLLPSDLFIDMLHTNTEGDLFMAKKMADYLMTHATK